jgi:hypothetical protein
MMLVDKIGLTKIPLIKNYLIKEKPKEQIMHQCEAKDISIGDFLSNMNKVNSKYFDI